jgi:membrane protein implicated in regulation of membrane protease activity
MFPVGDFSTAAYIAVALIGLPLGVISGVLTSILLRLHVRMSAMFIDALLGAAGAVITEAGFWRLYATFQYNFIVVLIIAVILPALHQYFRPDRERSEVKIE